MTAPSFNEVRQILKKWDNVRLRIQPGWAEPDLCCRERSGNKPRGGCIIEGGGRKLSGNLTTPILSHPLINFFWFLSEYFNLLHTRKKLHSLTTIKN